MRWLSSGAIWLCAAKWIYDRTAIFRRIVGAWHIATGTGVAEKSGALVCMGGAVVCDGSVSVDVEPRGYTIASYSWCNNYNNLLAAMANGDQNCRYWGGIDSVSTRTTGMGSGAPSSD